MLPRPLIRLLCLALTISLCPSCSVIGIKRLEPDLPAGEQPDCTSTWTLPLIDMGLAAITGSIAVVFFSAASSQENKDESSTGFRAAAWGSTATSVGFIASGSYGAYQRNRCRTAEVAAERAAPPPSFLEENKPLRGSAGAGCKDDSDCGEDLLCDQPMKTCVQSNPSEKSPSP